MNKRRILSRVLLAAATAALIFRGAFLLYFGDFYHEAQKAFPVPGLSSDFVPQGLESFGDGFLISGYLSRSGRARLYHMDALGGVSSLELRFHPFPQQMGIQCSFGPEAPEIIFGKGCGHFRPFGQAPQFFVLLRHTHEHFPQVHGCLDGADHIDGKHSR